MVFSKIGSLFNKPSETPDESESPETLFQRAELAYGEGQPEETVRLLDQALRLKPDASAFALRGNALLWLGRPAEAEAQYRSAIALEPGRARYHSNLGNVLMIQGRCEESAAACREAIRREPEHAQAHSNLGAALLRLGRSDEALPVLQRAVTLSPTLADAHYHLGTALRMQMRIREAVASFRTAVTLDHDYPDAWNDLGMGLLKLGEQDEAAQCFRICTELSPDRASAWSNRVYCSSYDPRETPEGYLALAREAGRRLSAKARPFATWDAPRDGPLRVGFVSGDLRSHPVGYFIDGVLGALDASAFTLFAYAANPVVEDPLADRLRQRFRHWRNIESLDDETAAGLIHDDGLHILIDLAGHTAFNRLGVFAWRPAPIQVSWLGYFASTGLAAMDYFIADAVSVQPGEDAHFSERVLRLPGSRLCFTPPDLSRPVEPAPPPVLTHGHVTLGCFQHLAKINNDVLRVWARILKALPSARLLFKYFGLDDAVQAAAWLQRLSLQGIPADRVILEGPADRETYLLAYHRVDFVLDTWPFTGGTTTCEAIWMGVPTLTLRGRNLLGRQGAAMMTAVGCPDWVAETEDDYVRKAIVFANDVGALAELRARLRGRLLSSPLGNPELFARNLEQAFTDIRRAFAEGKSVLEATDRMGPQG